MLDTDNGSGGNLADSIAMLEQILEVMPHDTDALKALYSANQKVGRIPQAFEYLGRLIDVFMDSKDAELLGFIRGELPGFTEYYPSEVSAQSARLRMVADSVPSSSPGPTSYAEPDVRSAPPRKESDISEELSLAWRLYEENQLSQDEYSSVLHDLTEISSKELEVPVSVLHVLNDRGYAQIGRIMSFLSARSGVPIISLSNFELQEEVAAVLPLEVSMHDGGLPFGFFGNDLLVAVLNPFNNALADNMELLSGHRCHTFLVDPEVYDAALIRLRDLRSKVAA